MSDKLRVQRGKTQTSYLRTPDNAQEIKIVEPAEHHTVVECFEVIWQRLADDRDLFKPNRNLKSRRAHHANAITTVEVLQHLIELAKEIRAARQRGEEVAFYDALPQNETAHEFLGYERLRVIARELLEMVKGNVTVDWMHHDSARARIRFLVKGILQLCE